MQENKFEKQVKNKMDELNLLPSAPVWEAIKKQIEKKKRRVLPFTFLLIAVAITGGYCMYVDINNNNNKPVNHSASADKKAIIIPSQNNVEKHSPSNTANLNRSSIIKNNKIYSLKNSSVFSIKNYRLAQNSKLVAIQNVNNYVQTNKPAKPSQLIITKNYSAITDTFNYNKAIIHIDSLKQSNNSFNQDNRHVQNDSNTLITKTNAIKNNDNKTFDINSSSVYKKQLHNKNNKPAAFNWGVIAMYGRSNLVYNFSLKSISSAQAGNVNTAAIDSIKRSEKPYWPAAAYNLGIVIQRKMYKHAYLNFGLQFLHLSIKSYTAISSNNSIIPATPFSLNSTTPANYYVPGTEKTYINKYNFIELPFSFQSNLLHTKQFALLYSIGGSVMQLINANALLFNSRSNTFFNDTSMLLRRTQFQLLSGIDIQLHTKSKGSFLIGTHVEYSLSGVLKNNDYDKLHYMHFDLQASWLFNKN